MENSNGYESRPYLPDEPSKCTWSRDKLTNQNPHTSRPVNLSSPKIYPNVLSVIGMTPVVKLNKIPQSLGIKCNMYVKCEYLNPGGSCKERVAFRMIQDAEDKGLIKPGGTFIEVTSGNTGTGVAMACVAKGYNCIIVMEGEKSVQVKTLKALGAKIIRTPVLPYDHPDSYYAVAYRLHKETPNSFLLNQYKNSGNPLAHYDGTGSEILYQLDGKVDMFVCSVGTGGTITGVGRKLKENCPECLVVGADPVGSILARPESLNVVKSLHYEVGGIGCDFPPTILDYSVIDEWVKVSDQESLSLARRLIQEEGFLCGASSGTALTAALKSAAKLREGQNCIVIIPDGIRNYMNGYMDDIWMEVKQFKKPENILNQPWWDLNISDISLENLMTKTDDISFGDLASLMKEQNLEYTLITDNDGIVKGVITLAIILQKMLKLGSKPFDLIANMEFDWSTVLKVNVDTPLGVVSRMLENNQFVLVVSKSLNGNIDDKVMLQDVRGVLTQGEFLNFICNFKN